MMELSIAPADEAVGRDLDEALAWPAFERDLRGFLEDLISAMQVDEFEVASLFVGEAPVGSAGLLRNGTVLSARDAIDLTVRMSAGHGPYCTLVSPGLRVENSWDGVTHLLLEGAALPFTRLAEERESLQISQCVVQVSEESDARMVDAAADSTFWRSVAKAPARVKLLCERWAYGSHGARWYRLANGDAFVVPQVEPRSILSVVLDPETKLERVDIDEGFIALGAMDEPGRIAHEEFPFGVDSLREVISKGWKHVVAEAATRTWVAVVPDTDGVLRASWPCLDM